VRAAARRVAAVVAVAAALVCAFDPRTSAHSSLRFSSPLEGSTLGDSPTHVQLTFVEAPEASLSSIRVVDTSGNAYHADALEAVSGDPLSLQVRLRPLGKGVYIVHWRAVSAVDGHASVGAFAFGILVDPSGVDAASAVGTTISMTEVVARTAMLAGLMLLAGAAAASLARFGSPPAITTAGAGWLLSVIGLLLLGVAQIRVADTGLSALAGTPIGRALVWRSIALAVAGLGVAAAMRGRRSGHERLIKTGMSVAALATLGLIVAHSTAGHAAAARWPVVPTVMLQVMHIVAAGAWLGGLVAVIAGLPRTPDHGSTAMIRRFSALAGLGLFVVAGSGIARAFQEVSVWRDLFTTTYGAFVTIKIALLAAIAVLGAVNRWRNVPDAAADLGPLRKTAALELVLAFLAVAAAGFLGALPPSAASRSIAGIEAAGVDFGTTVRVRLSAVSDRPGPNRFAVEVGDYDSGAPVIADRVSLRFAPLDDPGVTPTSLALAPTGEGSYAGSGATLSFAGRWRATVLVERRGSSVEVPLDIETRDPSQAVSVLRVPGESPVYTVEVPRIGFVRMSLDSEKAGSRQLRVSCFNIIPEVLPIDHLVVTTGTQVVRQSAVTRQDRNQFTAEVPLEPGQNRIAVVARSQIGTRLRVVLNLEVAQN
jgi:putative copper export protein/methionine-rich copper-binding protein CopC